MNDLLSLDDCFAEEILDDDATVTAAAETSTIEPLVRSPALNRLGNRSCYHFRLVTRYLRLGLDLSWKSPWLQTWVTASVLAAERNDFFCKNYLTQFFTSFHRLNLSGEGIEL